MTTVLRVVRFTVDLIADYSLPAVLLAAGGVCFALAAAGATCC